MLTALARGPRAADPRRRADHGRHPEACIWARGGALRGANAQSAGRVA